MVTEIEVGETVTADYTVTNRGSGVGDINVEFVYNGSVISSRQHTNLQPGESVSDAFSEVLDESFVGGADFAVQTTSSPGFVVSKSYNVSPAVIEPGVGDTIVTSINSLQLSEIGGDLQVEAVGAGGGGSSQSDELFSGGSGGAVTVVVDSSITQLDVGVGTGGQTRDDGGSEAGGTGPSDGGDGANAVSGGGGASTEVYDSNGTLICAADAGGGGSAPFGGGGGGARGGIGANGAQDGEGEGFGGDGGDNQGEDGESGGAEAGPASKTKVSESTSSNGGLFRSDGGDGNVTITYPSPN